MSLGSMVHVLFFLVELCVFREYVCAMGTQDTLPNKNYAPCGSRCPWQSTNPLARFLKVQVWGYTELNSRPRSTSISMMLFGRLSYLHASVSLLSKDTRRVYYPTGLGCWEGRMRPGALSIQFHAYGLETTLLNNY